MLPEDSGSPDGCAELAAAVPVPWVKVARPVKLRKVVENTGIVIFLIWRVEGR